MASLKPGRYKLRGSAKATTGASYPVTGEIILSSTDEAQRALLASRGARITASGVKGMLSDGPVVGGTWAPDSGRIKFQVGSHPTSSRNLMPSCL